MHLDRCICHHIPKIDVKTKVSLVVHHRELKRTTNTGRLAIHALVNSEMYIRGQDRTALDLSSILTADYESYILYPAEGSLDIECLKPSKPVQLIVSDGNWRQAGKLHRRHPELKNVPRVRISEKNLGTNHLRAEHFSNGYSTLEAIAVALGSLESLAVKESLLSLYQAKLKATLKGRGVIYLLSLALAVCVPSLSLCANSATPVENFCESVMTDENKGLQDLARRFASELSEAERSEILTELSSSQLATALAALIPTEQNTKVYFGDGEWRETPERWTGLRLKLLPALLRNGEAAGLTRDEAFRIFIQLVTRLKRPESFASTRESVYRLNQFFENVAKAKIRMHASQTELLIEIIRSAEDYYSLENTLYTLAFALRAGLTMQQSQELFKDIGEKQSGSGVTTLTHLQQLFKNTASLHLNPAALYDSLRAIFSFSRLLDDRYPRIVKAIDRAVQAEFFVNHRSPEILLRLVPHFVEAAKSHQVTYRNFETLFEEFLARFLDDSLVGFQTTLLPVPALAPESIDSGTRPLFLPEFPGIPLVKNGTLNSMIDSPYLIKKSYRAGLRDLNELCLDETLTSEGAFIYDHEKGIWISLGGTTRVSPGKARHEFEIPNPSIYGNTLSFFHIHPVALEHLVKIQSATMASKAQRNALSKFMAITPSQADILAALEIIEHFGPMRKIDFRISTSLGVLTYTIDVSQSSTRQKAVAENWIQLRDRAWTEDRPRAPPKSTLSEAALITYFLKRLNEVLEGTVVIKLETGAY